MGVTVPGTVAEAGLSKGPFRAPRGTQISCKGWQQEAALRMLLNNLDPEVAEKPEELGYQKSGIVKKPRRFSVATTVPSAFSRVER